MATKSPIVSRIVRHPWTITRKIIQYTILVVFIVTILAMRNINSAVRVGQTFMRLDLLTVLTHVLSSRTILWDSAIVLFVIILALAAGRAWCGWLCPLGTLLDLIPLRKKRTPEPKIPENWRKVKYFLLLAILFSALLTNLSLLVFDPVTILIRTLTTSLFPAIDQAYSASESAAFTIPLLQEPLAKLDTFLRPNILPINPAFYRYALIYTFILIGIVALNGFAHRFWCRYLCPLGGLFGWLSRWAVFRREVTQECKDCQVCSKSCPVGAIQPELGYISDPGECTMCMECVESCRLKGNKMEAHFHPGWKGQYDPSRRQVLGAVGLVAVALAGMKVQPESHHPGSLLIQPPGARENDFFAKCIRCGECIRACPTAGLQPAIAEAGIQGFFTPVLIPRIGYCDYACNACGQVCPVQAIPPLSLDEKRHTILGLAYIDQNRCIAWSDHVDCIVCEEMCPLPEKAIFLIPTSLPVSEQDTVNVKLPYVSRERCIGCGICESKCPVGGAAAIQVFTPGPQI